MTTKKLWIRKLSCGHERATNISFILEIYDKPKMGDKAYCRECCKEVEIIGVEEEKNIDLEFLDKMASEIDKGVQNGKDN